jgi:hypothetical protein
MSSDTAKTKRRILKKNLKECKELAINISIATNYSLNKLET